jgi:menaquinone-dependent protoporphyrinogen oxidase
MSPVRNLVNPVSEGYFAGALDFSKLPFSLNVLAMRLVVLSGTWKEGDHLDRNAISDWAKNLCPLLLQ